MPEDDLLILFMKKSFLQIHVSILNSPDILQSEFYPLCKNNLAVNIQHTELRPKIVS